MSNIETKQYSNTEDNLLKKENLIVKMIRKLGSLFISLFASTGRLAEFTIVALWSCLTPRFYYKQFFTQLLEVGFYSLPVVSLTCFFSGIVLVLQVKLGIGALSSPDTIAPIVTIALVREIGPTLAGIMVAGRIGAAQAAVIGTMRVTEQIDALQTLSTNPYKYLIAPRILAAVISLPLLVMLGDLIGIIGGFVVVYFRLEISPLLYLQLSYSSVDFQDISSGLVKALVFGFVISIVSCYHGYYSKGGASGVGKATTNAVVLSSILILFFNYILTGLFF